MTAIILVAIFVFAVLFGAASAFVTTLAFRLRRRERRRPPAAAGLRSKRKRLDSMVEIGGWRIH